MLKGREDFKIKYDRIFRKISDAQNMVLKGKIYPSVRLKIIFFDIVHNFFNNFKPLTEQQETYHT